MKFLTHKLLENCSKYFLSSEYHRCVKTNVSFRNWFLEFRSFVNSEIEIHQIGMSERN